MRILRHIILAAATFSVAACTLNVPNTEITAPEVTLPDAGGHIDLPQRILPHVPEIAAAASPASNALRLYYARMANDLRSSGFLKQDLGTAADASQIGKTFKALAFSNEFEDQQQPLQRWFTGTTMRIGLHFGPSVPDADQVRLTNETDNLLTDLRIATGLPIRLVSRSVNVNVFVVNEGERRALAPTLQAGMPSLAWRDIARITSMTRDEQCLVMAFPGVVDHTRDRAIIIIREELPPTLQLACLHEEISQAIGLTNDSPIANPSIFNDDDEYATLTGLDRQLLKLLYHPELKPGMTLETAGPIIDRITATAPFTGG